MEYRVAPYSNLISDIQRSTFSIGAFMECLAFLFCKCSGYQSWFSVAETGELQKKSEDYEMKNEVLELENRELKEIIEEFKLD